MREHDEMSLDELLPFMVEEGKLKYGKDKEGESSYSLTESGIRDAERVLGGRDIGNVASALTKLIVKHGNAIGGHIDDDVGTWLVMVRIAHLWKEYHDLPWKDFVDKLENEVLEPIGFFNHATRAFKEESDE